MANRSRYTQSQIDEMLAAYQEWRDTPAPKPSLEEFCRTLGVSKPTLCAWRRAREARLPLLAEIERLKQRLRDLGHAA